MMSSGKDHRQFFAQLRQRGYTIDDTMSRRHTYIRWQGHIVTVASHNGGSDYRTFANLKADVRRWEQGMHALADAAKAAQERAPELGSCDIDGYWEDPQGRDHYWHCEEPAAGVVGDLSVCLRHELEILEECGT
jgi:hypothetical protein